MPKCVIKKYLKWSDKLAAKGDFDPSGFMDSDSSFWIF